MKLTPQRPFSTRSFIEPQLYLSIPEDPNRDYPAGHYLPFPMAVVDFSSPGDFSVEIQVVPKENAMAHITVKSGYEKLVERLNRLPQGAPPSDTLYAILKMLFSEREAGLVAQLPIIPFTARKAAQVWNIRESEAQNMLDALASRAILLDTVQPSGLQTYVLPPPMAGFFEFSMMRLRGDIDQHLLGGVILPIPQRGGGVHKGSLHQRRDSAWAGVRARTGSTHRQCFARPGL